MNKRSKERPPPHPSPTHIDIFAEWRGVAGDATSQASIGEVCDEFCVTTRTLRFYEDAGLIHPERRRSLRYYSDSDRERIALILEAKGMGFRLAEIAEAMVAVSQDRHTVKLSVPVDLLEVKREGLARLRDDIEAALARIDRHLAAFQQILTGPLNHERH